MDEDFKKQVLSRLSDNQASLKIVHEKLDGIGPLRETVELNTKEISRIDNKCSDIENTLEIQADEINKLKFENFKLSEELKLLAEKELMNESQMRRNNLIFSGTGLSESNPDNCEQKIKFIIKNQMGLYTDGDALSFLSCYRLGPKLPNVSMARPILVKFYNYKDRMLVWKSRKMLKEIFVNEDFPEEILERRRKMKPILKKALELKMDAYLVADKLVVDRKVYKISDLHKLDPDLNPVKFSTRTVDEGVIAFYSGHSPLSNFHDAKFTENGQQYQHVEQYYGYNKALAASDEITAAKILHTKSPLQCLKLHKGLKFDVRQWKEQDSVMKNGCMLKFSQNPNLKQFLLNTNHSKLIEANKSDKYWGAGLALEDFETLEDKSRLNGKNKLGKILEAVRELLQN